MKSGVLQKTRGQSAIEFFITMFAFTIMFFAIGDMIKITYAWGGIQYATNRGVRISKTMSYMSTNDARIAAVKAEITRVTNALRITVPQNDIEVTIAGNSLEANTRKAVVLGPVAGMILRMAGDHSGTYDLRVREVIRSESY